MRKLKGFEIMKVGDTIRYKLGGTMIVDGLAGLTVDEFLKDWDEDNEFSHVEREGRGNYRVHLTALSWRLVYAIAGVVTVLAMFIFSGR